MRGFAHIELLLYLYGVLTMLNRFKGTKRPRKNGKTERKRVKCLWIRFVQRCRSLFFFIAILPEMEEYREVGKEFRY
jgi:hypothetical protein